MMYRHLFVIYTDDTDQAGSDFEVSTPSNDDRRAWRFAAREWERRAGRPMENHEEHLCSHQYTLGVDP